MTRVEQADPRRWRALAVLALVQFIIFLDATIVNVALPSIQHDLGFTSTGLTWVVNGYLLAAGGLLLVGGRLADIFGRRRLFSFGAALFAVASLTAALANSPGVLIAGRFAQGIAEAVAAPAAMALVALLFTDDAERGKAFSIWGGLAGLGSAAGVLLSGVLTEFGSWRWVFFINIPLAVIPLLLTPRLIDESKMTGARRPSWVSAVLATLSMVAVIQGVLALTSHPFASAQVLVPLGVGLLALVVFLVLQARSENPLIPLGFLADRTRVAGNLGVVALNGSTAAMFFLLVLYMQEVVGWSPLQNGLAWLPFCIAFMVGLTAAMKLLPKYGPRLPLTAGLLSGAAGMTLLAFVPVHGNFWVNLLPGMLLIAIGGGMANPSGQTAALSNVSQEDAGLGSGILTTVAQLGQALGLALIVTLAISSAKSDSSTGDAATVHGYHIAFVAAAAALAVGALLSFTLLGLRARQTTGASAGDRSLAEQSA